MSIKKTLKNIAKLDNAGQQKLEDATVRGVVEAIILVDTLRDLGNSNVATQCIAMLMQKGFSHERAEWTVNYYRTLSRPKQDDPNDADCKQCKNYSQEEYEVDDQEGETILDNNLQGYCDYFAKKE